MRDIFETCYLDYVGLGHFEPELFRNPTEKNSKDYRDPDSYCEELYDDLMKIYESKFKSLGFTISKNKGEYTLWMDKNNLSYTMSSDYIGPSRAFAKEVGIADSEVGDYLRKTRVIGGHTLWPVQYREDNRNTIVITGRGGTINTQKGGNKGFCDRIDCTLQDLKNFYDSKSNDEYKLKAFEKYKNWLSLFGNFNTFIDFFYLNDFCDSDYRVFDLKSYNSQKDSYETFICDGYKEISNYKISNKEEYELYISGCTSAILKRQVRIKQDFGKQNR